MPRERSENRDRAFEIFKEAGGNITNREIARQLDISEKSISGWKCKDKWNDQLNGVLRKNDRSTPKKKKKAKGAPKGNKNAVGHGAPAGNKNAEKHGFFSRIFPDDPETQEIIEEIQIKSPLEILWEQIVIQYTAIARSQKLMFVKDQEDKTIEKVGNQRGKIIGEKWEVQQAWDKHASFLTAQSRAIQTLERLIARYDEMLLKDLQTEEQQLRIDKLKAEIVRLKGEEIEIEDDGFLEALESSVKEVWADGEEV